MEYITLNNGINMPILGFGVFRITDEKECEEIVLNALKAGYRHIDTASAYGNEKAVGKAIKKKWYCKRRIICYNKVMGN